MRRNRSFFVSLPERALRALVAALGGAVHETAEVVLPRFARRSRLYEATAKNMLRIAIELVGSVEREAPVGEPTPSELLRRKTAGNVVELSSIAAFGFSPLWLLAAASDISHGSRVYLAALVAELKRAGVLAEEAEPGTVDALLGVLEGTTGTTAMLVDLPPLELAELRTSLAELRSSASELPSPRELAGLYQGLWRTAARERQPLLEVSAGMGLAFLLSARQLGREHLIAPVPGGLEAVARGRLRRLRAQGREAVPGSDDGALRPRARVVDGESADAVPPLESSRESSHFSQVLRVTCSP